MLRHIMPLVNAFPYIKYVEPFAGGASVYFALKKENAKTYILNDMDDQILNFYYQCQTNSAALIEMVKARAVASRTLNIHAKDIFYGRHQTDNTERAWAVFYLLRTNWNGAFSMPLCAKYSIVTGLENKAAELEARCRDIGKCVIEATNGVEMLRRYDKPDTLFYCDPPYVNTEQFHYEGFRQADLDELLEKLVTLEGGFILSHYNSEPLRNWAAQHGFQCDVIKTKISIAVATLGKEREELLIYNFARRALL